MAAMKTITHHARMLRRTQTHEEQRLWYLLRDRRFARYKFRRQHPVGDIFSILPAARFVWRLNWMAGSMRHRLNMTGAGKRG